MPVIDDFSEDGGDRYFLREDAFEFTLIRERRPDGNVSDSQAWPVRILGRRLKWWRFKLDNAHAAERARIRKELLAWLSLNRFSDGSEQYWLRRDEFRAALDRICPEEPAGERERKGD